MTSGDTAAGARESAGLKRAAGSVAAELGSGTDGDPGGTASPATTGSVAAGARAGGDEAETEATPGRGATATPDDEDERDETGEANRDVEGEPGGEGGAEGGGGPVGAASDTREKPGGGGGGSP